MELIICFIDDSVFEHSLVREEIAPSFPDLQFIQTYTFDEAREKLGDRIPGLFLLDLWGQDPDVESPTITSKEELIDIVKGFNGIEDVYKGLDDFKGDLNNEYLKRIFSIVDSWRSLFELVCVRVGQNNKYGLSNLQGVRRYFPGIPGVFYTRKSLINDAVAMFKAGADGLFIKPTGKNDKETRQKTREKAPSIINEILGIIDSEIEKIHLYESFYHNNERYTDLDIKKLISTWKEFISK